MNLDSDILLAFMLCWRAVYNHLHGKGPFDENYVLDNVLIIIVLLISSQTTLSSQYLWPA